MRLIKPLLTIAVLGAGGFAVWHLTRARPAPPPQTVATPVNVATAKQGDVPVYLRTIGTVRPLNSVDIRPQVGGVLVEVAVKEGDEVKKGQVIALIDPRPLKAALEKAQAQLKQDQAQLSNAELDRQRYTTLASRDFASRQQLDTQVSTVDRLQGVVAADQASIDDASVNLSYAVLTAPFDGRIGIRRVDPGNLVQANATQPIFTIVQEHPTSVLFSLPETDLPAVRDAQTKGTPTVIADTADDRRVLGRGTLMTVDNAVDSNSGTIQLRGIFPNPDGALTAGQFVDIRLQVDVAHGVIVPHTAVQHGQQGLFVFTVDPDKTVKRHDIHLVHDDGSVAVLKDGVAATTVVVTAGQSRIGDGTKVTTQEGGASGSEPSTQQSAQK